MTAEKAGGRPNGDVGRRRRSMPCSAESDVHRNRVWSVRGSAEMRLTSTGYINHHRMALRSALRSTIPRFTTTTTRAMSSVAPTHNYAPRAGFDDSGSSGLYHTARPDYPRESIRAILSAAASDSSAAQLNVLEIGSGTGISTECLVREAGESNLKIRNYLAVEPSHGMRAGWNDFIASKLLPDLVKQGKLPSDAHVECRDGTFEELNLSQEQKGTFDTVVIAQAYHWCPDYEKSLSAILEALRPGGKLALIWNLEDNTTDATWVKELRDLYEVYEDNTPQYRHMYWKKLYDLPLVQSSFKYNTEGQHYRRTIPTTVQGVKNRVLSKSYISLLSDDKKAALQSQIDELFARGDDQIGRKWIDKEQGVFEYPYVTDLYLFEKK